MEAIGKTSRMSKTNLQNAGLSMLKKSNVSGLSKGGTSSQLPPLNQKSSRMLGNRPTSKYSQSGVARKAMIESESDFFGDGDILNKSSEAFWMKQRKQTQLVAKGPRMINQDSNFDLIEHASQKENKPRNQSGLQRRTSRAGSRCSSAHRRDQYDQQRQKAAMRQSGANMRPPSGFNRQTY
jgi:hypothetical protein